MAELYIFGNIKRALGFKVPNLNAAYNISLNDGWTSEGGELSGQSQFDQPENSQFEGHIFNLPFEIFMKTTTMTNWPKVDLRLNTLDNKQLKQLVGQCEVFIPTQPGKYTLKVPAWKVSRDTVMRAEGPGKPQPGGSVVYEGDKACLLTETAGDVEIELFVVVNGFSDRGIIL
ncbi:B9_protein family domain-containing protein [Hexamita inflata]|uniref:B9 domain-containing protein 2 n=1 Tax=Hexamita inflata TaxID=28002 RepID=A0AA86NB34_9EUKA|nr:B9 protein family domain-containing protein [Hexamita inflata]CAI9916218.1 B9 protein family domain-containing protein [Hexamita inflata]